MCCFTFVLLNLAVLDINNHNSGERSKWRFSRLTCTGTARSSPTSSPSQLGSRTVTS